MVKVRLFQKGDIEHIAQIEDESFTSPYPKYFLKLLAKSFPDLFLVLIEPQNDIEHICGYAVAEVNQVEHFSNGHIISVAISRPYRRKGFGTELIHELIRRFKVKNCKQVSLEVRIKNQVAIKMYQKLGFKKSGIIQGYYDNGEAALVMVLNLEETA